MAARRDRERRSTAAAKACLSSAADVEILPATAFTDHDVRQ